ncbi:MAG: DUF3793 family protein [Treponema sp.]
MSYSDCKCFEQKLAYHTAPALLGIKTANLFSICKSEFDSESLNYFNERVKNKGLRLLEICECKNRKLLMLYNIEKLDSQLHDVQSMKILGRYGYHKNMTTEEMLYRLSCRIKAEDGFPHEIGIFLGYPIDDVYGFIKNNGENFKFCGYWKVYGDIEKAKRTFSNYRKCRDFLCNKLVQGQDIYQALKIS